MSGPAAGGGRAARPLRFGRSHPLRCPACQHENRADARFCLSCGTELVRRCPGCERELPAAARFCDACGRAVEPDAEATCAPAARDPRSYTPRHLAERILTSRAAIEGERKHVTVLFADLADSTALAGRLDPETMHALMDRAFQLMLEQVHRWEGTVNQFTGDGIMALFGAPLALEEAPRRAVTAALGIQRALAPLDAEVQERHGAAFRMRIGINSGTVVVGRVGDDLRMDYTAVGDATNLADRLQALARPGGVVISASCERLVEGFFELEPLPPTQVKGVAGAVQAYEVVAERSVPGRLEAAERAGLTPFVGRVRELDQLDAAFESARAGQGRVAFLVGEAGIGKSRLRYEFRRRLRDVPHFWMEGRCASWARDTAFHVVADLLRRSFGIEDRDDDATALAKLEHMEGEAGDDLRWTLPYVRGLLSLPVGDAETEAMDAASRRSETFRALRARFLRAATRRPLVLVVEDLHWIDAASMEFLAYLSESVPTAHALLLLTTRPGNRHPFGDRSYHVRIALQSLSQDEMASMTGALLASQALPEELRELVTRKAEGNPFFVEEVVRSLLEEGVLQQVDGRIALTRKLSEASIPDRIQDVLMARLDRLSDEPKRALQVASVIGREFALRLLQRSVEASDRVPDLVAELRSLELVYEKSGHPELAFMFKHALTHEVAYASILVQRRKALHRLVGAAIEELYRDRLSEHYEALAHHFSVAEDWERALRYHDLASHKALEAYANHSAAEHCRQALEIADRLGDRSPEDLRQKLAERLALACWLVSDFRASGEAFRLAAEAAPEPGRRAVLLARGAYSFLWAHEYAEEQRAVAEADALAREVGHRAAEGMAMTVRACDVGWLGGDLETCERLTRRASELCAGDEAAAAFVEMHLGEIAEWRGNFHEALRIEQTAVERARRLGLADIAMFASWFFGKALCCVGRYGEALAQFAGGLELADRVGDRAVKARLLNTLGWCYAEIGSDERARDCNRRSQELALELLDLALVAGADEVYGNATINLAGNHVALGELDAAEASLEPLREHLARSADPWMRWRYELHLLDVRARLALARGEPETARRLAGEEVEAARRHGSRKLEARGLELAGRALVVLDARDAAERSLEAALGLARSLGHPPVAWRALSLLGELAHRAGRERVHAEEARALAVGLAGSLPEAGLAAGLRALGERMARDPLGAYR